MAAASAATYTRNPDGSVVLATTGKLAWQGRGGGLGKQAPLARPITAMSGVKIIAPKGQGTSGKSAYS
jgi:hypothetical protein